MAYKIKLNVLKSLQSNPKMCLSAIRKYLINMLVYFADVQKANDTPLHQIQQKSRMQKWKPIIHNERQ